MEVQNINSAPKYITDFISVNIDKLNEIYKEGLSDNPMGILSCKCSESENKMDIFFMNEELILDILKKEFWESYKKNIPEDKKLMYINDLDLNCIFLITI